MFITRKRPALLLSIIFSFLVFVNIYFGPALADIGNIGLWGDQGNGTYKNPILPGDYSDIDAIRVGSDYYMISSTFHYSPGVIVLKSNDLVNWTIIGHVVGDLTQMHSRYSYTTMNSYGRGIWAGAIRYYQNKFWVYYGTPDDGYFMSTATNPAGPWDPLTRVTYDNNPSYPAAGWDDCCPFWDDDGQGYFIGSNFSDSYKIHLWKMSVDGKQLLSATDTVIHQAGGSEANKIYKINGYYYFFHSETTGGTREIYMLRSTNIYGAGGTVGQAGTYEEKKVQENVGGDREPNQGGLVQTEAGSWYFVTHQGSMGLEGRPANLLPVSWVNNWPVFGVDTDGDGAGEMIWSGNKPISGFSITVPQSSDEFNSTTLAPQWEWNYQPRADMWSLSSRAGYMRLKAFKPLASDNLFKAGNTLSQRYMRGDWGEAVVKMEINNMANGQEAGFSHFGGGSKYCTIGVNQSGGVRTFRYKNTTTGSVLTGPTISSSNTTVWLKSVMTNSQNTAFMYSLDGTVFTTLGGTYDLVGADYRGDRLGIYCFNNTSESGYVDIDWFHYTFAGPNITPTPTPSPLPPQTDPVTWYKFDESNGTMAADSSGNGKNATLVNGPTWVAGKSGNAVNLEGTDDYVSMPTGIVSSLNDFTIAAWVKLDTISTWSRVFDFGAGTTANMFLTTKSSSNVIRYAITTGGGGGEQQINGTAALPTGSWQHVAVTLSGSLGILYVNGAEVARNSSMTLKPSNLGSTNLNYIGKSQYSDPYLDGLIDDFRIYNRALSAAEVQTLFGGSGSTPTPTPTPVVTNTPTPTPTPAVTVTPSPTPGGGLTVWYKFDESNGTTAADSSGNGKNATLVNGPTWVAGKSGNAVNLDGTNDYLSMPTGIISSLNDFTIAAWVKLDTISTWSRVFDFGTGTNVNMFLTAKSSSNVIRYGITTNSYNGEQQINGTAALPTGSWQHVAVTLSGSLGVLYVNGAEVGRNSSMTLKPSSLGSTNLNYIGKSQYSDPYLDGQVDGFRIYNRALSAAEVNGLYTAGN